jgi:hypothetical protein
VYRIVTDGEVSKQIVALPAHALEAYAEALDVLQLVPWNGAPHNDANPDGPMRQLVFGPRGEGVVVYLILEDQQRVDPLIVFWLS